MRLDENDRVVGGADIVGRRRRGRSKAVGTASTVFCKNCWLEAFDRGAPSVVRITSLSTKTVARAP